MAKRQSGNQSDYRSLSLVILLSLSMGYGCSQQTEQLEVSFKEMDEKYSDISYQEIPLELDQNSFVGFFAFGEHTLFYVDQLFSQIHTFDLEFNKAGEFLGKGDGPDRQNVINGFLPYVDAKSHLIVGGNETVLFDLDFSRQSNYPISWDYSDSYSEMENSPNASMIGLYEIAWRSRGNNLSLLVDINRKEILFPLEMSHPKLNGFLHKEYYESVHTIGKYSMNQKKINGVFGNRSSVYLEYPFIPNFDFFYLESKSDSILVSFAVDPMIHILDSKFNLIGKFGYEGVGVSQNYPKTDNIENAIDNYKEDLTKAGFYGHLYYDKKSGYLFRSYFPEGKGKGYSRLQVFENQVLIADVKVPERFRVIGNSENGFIADGVLDEKNETMAIYQFELK